MTLTLCNVDEIDFIENSWPWEGLLHISYSKQIRKSKQSISVGQEIVKSSKNSKLGH